MVTNLHNKTMQVFYYKLTHKPVSLVFVANLTERFARKRTLTMDFKILLAFKHEIKIYTYLLLMLCISVLKEIHKGIIFHKSCFTISLQDHLHSFHMTSPFQPSPHQLALMAIVDIFWAKVEKQGGGPPRLSCRRETTDIALSKYTSTCQFAILI